MGKRIILSRWQPPCGDMIMASYADTLVMAQWDGGKQGHAVWHRLNKYFGSPERVWGSSPAIDEAKAQLEEYFKGKRRKFDLALLLLGTDFQKAVWSELLRLPYGTTISYGRLAERIGYPAAQRAVANANATNSLSVIVPCHRVIGADGNLTGYNGGVSIKHFLLSLERYGGATLL